MSPASMEDIAHAIRSHLVSSTLDIHLLNNLLHPDVSLAFTPRRSASPPSEDPSSFTAINRPSAGTLHHGRLLAMGRPPPSPPFSDRTSSVLHSLELELGSEQERGPSASPGPVRELGHERVQQEQEYDKQQEKQQEQQQEQEEEQEHEQVQEQGQEQGQSQEEEHGKDEQEEHTSGLGRRSETAYPSALATIPPRRQGGKRKAMASTVSTVKKSSLLSQKEGEGKDFALQRKEINRLLCKECKDNIANDVYGENDEQREAKARREQFVQHWSTRTRGFSDWGRLDALAIIPGASSSPVPYEDLSRVMRWANVIGASHMHAVFGTSVRAWISSSQTSQTIMELPSHLHDIPDINAAPIQKFWRAVEMSRSRREIEGMATLLARKAWVEMLSAYQEAVIEIRRDSQKKRIKLASGEKATTKARETLYAIVYPDLQTRTEAQKQFNKDQKRATAYHRLYKHYGHSGILALIPKMDDTAFRATDALHQALLRVLDIVHPELHGERLVFYGKVIDYIYAGLRPNGDELAKLHEYTAGEVADGRLGQRDVCIRGPV